MKVNQLVHARTPRNGAIKVGRFIREVMTHNGVWLEIAPVDAADRKIKDAEPFRSRPACVVPV